MYTRYYFLIFGLGISGLWAQVASDSTYILEPVQISLYASDRPAFVSPSSIYTIGSEVFALQTPQSLVAALNTVPGMRMEERSPGSYRLSIRGSLLRSPFGVRNIKVYMDEFPLTDAGGNTYLNALDPGSVHKVELVKGPEGSVYGANTGGVLVVNPDLAVPTQERCKASTVLGSYGLLQQQLSYQKNVQKYSFKLYQGIQSSKGYREHSAMRRYFAQGNFTWNYAKGARLKFLGMYSDLHYQTPGGLNATQWASDPHGARPAAGNIPGAKIQQAGIYNKWYYGGVVHETDVNARLKHVVSVFGNISDFKNPFISNYEIRKEGSWGSRTYLKGTSRRGVKLPWEAYLGIEVQQTQAFIDNYGNRRGVRDTMQASDGLKALQCFYFARFVADLSRRWVLEMALSVNDYTYLYKNYFPRVGERWHTQNFDKALMPKVASSYRLRSWLVGRASVSKGFSPPTIAEVRPSDQLVYDRLQAETGWNYEVGLRWKGFKNRFKGDLVFFYMSLNQAIVRKVNSSGAEYFENAGKTSQPGVEAQVSALVWSSKKVEKIRNITWSNSITGYHFTFANYKTGNVDASGRRLTGVPDFTWVSGLKTEWEPWSLCLQYNYTSAIPLNDANSVKADPYHLVQAQLGYKIITGAGVHLQIQMGADNLLNQKYSLGNDLNAFGGRYFNAAAPRNWYVRLTFYV